MPSFGEGSHLKTLTGIAGHKHNQLSDSFWSDKSLCGLKFSLNSLPGDAVAEP